MTFQGRGGGHRPPDGFVCPPPASTPRPVPCRSPGSGILHRAAMALPHHAAYGAPPVLHRPSACGFSPRPPVSVPTAPSVATEALGKLLVPCTALGPAAAAAASASTPPSSAAPAGWVFSAPAPPSPAGLRDVADKVPFVSEAALPPPGAAGPSALDLPPGCLPKPARRGLGTICVVNTSLDDVDSYNLHVYDITQQEFTEMAWQAIVSSPEVAKESKHQIVETEHLMKSLLEQRNGLARRIFSKAGVDNTRLLDATEKFIQRQPKVLGEEPGSMLGRDLEALIQRARDFSKDYGDSYVSDEHLVLGFAEDKRFGKQLFKDFQVTVKTLNSAIESIRGNQNVIDQDPEGKYEAMEKYGKDLTAMARQGKLDPVIGRDDEIRRCIQILSRRTKNNPVLIGEPGVGKTAIAEGLAQRIVQGDVPQALTNRRDQDIRYKMTGITPIPMSQLIFPVDEKGTSVTLLHYFGDNYRLQYDSWPHFQTGSHPQPMQVCHDMGGRRCSKKLNDKQGNNVLRAACNPHQERKLVCDVALPDKTAEDKSSQELDRNVCTDLVTTVAAHALPPPVVNVFFCGFRIRVPAIGATVLDLVQLALLKQNIRIRLQDFYLMLNFKMTDRSVLLNSIPNLEESTICVCPRLKGAPVQQPVVYVQLDAIVNNNHDQLFRKLQIPQGMVDPTCPRGSCATFMSHLPQFLIHQLLLLVCREGHLEDHCYHGRFDLSRILVSSCGHVRFRSDVWRKPYTAEGSEADYQRIFFIVMTFVDLTTRRYPIHVANLLWILRNAPESLRKKEEFIAFLTNHPSLLTFAERQMLYSLIDAFLFTLLRTQFDDLNVQAEVDELKRWIQTTGGWGWENKLQNVPDFFKAYMRGAKRPKGAPRSSPKVSVYQKEVDQCLRLSRNFLGHTYVRVGLELAEAAVSYLLGFVLPVVLYNLARCLSGENGAAFIGIVSNPRADRTTVTPFWGDDDAAAAGAGAN